MQNEAATSHMIFTSDVENTDSLYGELISPALKRISYCMKHEWMKKLKRHMEIYEGSAKSKKETEHTAIHLSSII